MKESYCSASLIRSLWLPLLCICLPFAVAPTVAGADVQPKMAGGTTPDLSAWPWTTALTRNDKPSCTASLIAPTRLLTAAHCVKHGETVDRARDFDAYINRRNKTTLLGQHRTVTAIAVHPGYSRGGSASGNNDVAVMFLNAPVTDISPVPLGNENDWGLPYGPPYGSTCGQFQNETCYWGIAIGWGHTSYSHTNSTPAQTFQAGDFTLGSDSYCRFLIDGRGVNTHIASTQFCIYDYDGVTCLTHGDSGGPFVVRVSGQWRQIGVASHFSSPLTWGNCQPGSTFGGNVLTEAWVAGNALRGWITSLRNPLCPSAAKAKRAAKKRYRRLRTKKAKRKLRRAKARYRRICFS
jgi:secreted trypsin-like serine protease